MKTNPFLLERYFAEYEFKVKYLLSPSDCESLSMADLLQMAAPESLDMWQDLKLGYTESQGHPLLRAEIARLYQHVQADNVLVAAPEEAIFIAMQTLLLPGEHAVVISPAYQSLYEIVRSIGCSVTPWAFTPGSSSWQLDLDQLEASLTKDTRLLVINFPHNPTGYLPSSQDLDAVVKLARRNDLYLFSDEMYRLLEYDPAKRLPPVCDLYEKGISLSGLSKAFALPGLRIGWLAAQERALVDRWLAFKDYTTICNSAPSEILGTIALQNKERILERSRAIILENLAIAQSFFDNQADRFEWFEPLAGSVAFPRWRGEGTIEQFCREILDQRGVMIVPGSIFEYPGNHFRVGLGRRNFAEALEQVAEYLKVL
jgi:aspartate/methionine/tyrosine aminotransferase